MNPGRVLVVEQDPAVRRVLCTAIDWAGLTAMDAEDGEQAMNMYMRVGADLVITNILMPNMNGFCLLQALRRYGLDVKVVFIVNGNTTPHSMRGSAGKPDGYLNKPFSASELLELCKRMIGNKFPALT